jgi:hypothetical protein
MSLTLTIICVQAFIMSTQFYLTLPSNSSMKYFPQNTVANFRVKLADRIVLPGQWEVALTGLHYPAAHMEHGQNWRAANVHI